MAEVSTPQVRVLVKRMFDVKRSHGLPLVGADRHRRRRGRSEVRVGGHRLREVGGCWSYVCSVCPWAGRRNRSGRGMPCEFALRGKRRESSDGQ